MIIDASFQKCRNVDSSQWRADGGRHARDGGDVGRIDVPDSFTPVCIRRGGCLNVD
jgi:hypothetical protein